LDRVVVVVDQVVEDQVVEDQDQGQDQVDVPQTHF
jgi:hypothetical protein